MARKALLALLLAGAAFLALRWPLLNVVETGKTPAYPDLQPREYRASEEQVEKALRAAVDGLPGWRYVGSGSGPGGRALQALYTLPVGLEHDVDVRIRRDGGVTRVSVRSRSRVGPIDLGQNARNIRSLLSALDTRLAR
jgi:uncharacterized protein (DUF1499 family)